MMRIENVKTPVVGKFYFVPCIHTDQTRLQSWDTWIPIIGPWHEDAEIIMFEAPHFHLDWRFVQYIRFDELGRNHSLVACSTVGGNSASQPTVVYKRKMMWREMIEFPSSTTSGEVPWMRTLEAKYKNHQLKCNTCPHRGMSLEGLPQDEQGRVVCNGHGLRWNLKTGKLAPRLTHAHK